MYRYLFFYLLLTTFLFSCKNEDKKSEGYSIEQDKDKATAPNYLAKNYCAQLEGSIGGRPIVMHLMKSGNILFGNYYYHDIGRPIFFYSDWNEPLNDSVCMVEGGNSSAEPNAICLMFNKDTIKGTWARADEKTTYPFVLKEQSSKPANMFNVFTYSDSATYLKFPKDTPMAKSAIALLVANDNDATGSWFNNSVKNILFNDDKKESTLPVAAKTSVNNFLQRYQADVDSSIKDVGAPADDMHYFLNRQHDLVANLIYNGNKYTVLSVFNYGYYGGAHGMYQTAFYCFDMQEKNILSLQDVLTISPAVLQTLLEKSYRKQHALSPQTPLSDKLLVDEILPNKNFYFTEKGIGFMYAPYEIASYADGEIDIWIPFSELTPYLQPSFAKRMEL